MLEAYRFQGTQSTCVATRNPAYEPGNATRYDITIVFVSETEILVALWPGLHCSACAVFRDDQELDASYVAEKLRIGLADAQAIVDFLQKHDDDD